MLESLEPVLFDWRVFGGLLGVTLSEVLWSSVTSSITPWSGDGSMKL